MTDYNEIIEDEAFRRFVTLIRICDRPEWRHKHQPNQFGFYYNQLVNRVRASANTGQLLDSFTNMMQSAIEADIALSPIYTEDVVLWFARLLDAKQAERKMVLSVAFAMASCEDKFITPVEASELTGNAESHWRNKCAQGHVPGAKKFGKQWLIPSEVIRFLTEI